MEKCVRYFCFGILIFNTIQICSMIENVTRDCKYFLEGRGLVPRILRVSPNQTCTIIYNDTTVIQSGKTYDEFECGGTIKIKWNRRNNSTYYTVYMFGVSFIYAHAWDKRWKNWEPPDEWLYWVVTNIQDDNIDNGTNKGSVLFKYRDPLDTTNWEDHFYIIVLVYEQPGKINVEYQDIHPKGQFKYRTYYPKARPFAFKYQLGDAIAGNAFEFKEVDAPPEAEEFSLINKQQIAENLPRLISKLSSMGFTPFLSFHNKSYSVSWLPERDYKRDYERDSE